MPRVFNNSITSVVFSCLEKPLGSLGEIDVETEGILIEYGIDFAEFSEDVYVGLPREVPWTIPEVLHCFLLCAQT